MHILIAEDDAFLRTVYTTELTKVGYTVTCAEDGESALKALLSDPRPDLLLLDVLMPKKDGFQVLEEKMINPAIEGIPVVMLTSLEGEKDMERAAKLGVANYFVKTNMDIEELLSLIRNILPVKNTTSGLIQYRDAYITDTKDCMSKARASLASLDHNPSDTVLIFDVMRLFHSVKSSSALMGFNDLSARCLGIEQRYKKILDAKAAVSAEDRSVALETVARIEETIAPLTSA
jgi:DNA-binding response OmpR family regulator